MSYTFFLLSVQAVLTKCQFMMDFELKLEKPNVSRAWISAATMGASYFIGEWPHTGAEEIIGSFVLRRRSDSHDTLFCHAKRHSCVVYIHRHHGCDTLGFWVHQELGHCTHEAVGCIWGSADSVCGSIGRWDQLWDCAGHQFEEHNTHRVDSVCKKCDGGRSLHGGVVSFIDTSSQVGLPSTVEAFDNDM
jgi:hypothetical protein